MIVTSARLNYENKYIFFSGRTGILSSHAVLVVLLALCSGTPAMKFKSMLLLLKETQ